MEEPRCNPRVLVCGGDWAGETKHPRLAVLCSEELGADWL